MGKRETNKVLRQLNNPVVQKRTPIATDMFLPNHSGDHSAGHTGTPINDNDIANKKYVDDSIHINDGTATGQMAYWNGSVWTPISTDKLFWEDTPMGEIGMGTTTPLGVFHAVDNGSYSSGAFRFVLEQQSSNRDARFALRNNAGAQLSLQMAGSNYYLPAFYGRGALFLEGGTKLEIQTNAGQPIIFSPRFTEAMRIMDGGNVGIGTATPSKKLDVNGDISLEAGSGDYYSNDGSQGFTGTGAYTNFTIKNGIITDAS